MKSELFESIVRACEPEQVDWTKVGSLVASLGPAINDRYEDGSVLSELYADMDAYKQGRKLLEITRIFLSLGYDVRANDGMNGGECLRNLCCSSYDGYILKTAELLLDAGADPDYSRSDGSDKSDILDDISWKLGYWHTGEYLEADLFEAYYRMIELAQSGEDYHGIQDAPSCIGKRISKIEKLTLVHQEADDRSREFHIIWCEETPLVVSQTVEIYVDPSVDRFDAYREDLSGQYRDLIGSRVVDFLYVSSASAQLVLDGGRPLVIIGDEREGKPFARLVEAEAHPEAFLDEKSIVGLYFSTGVSYSDSCRSYEEDAVLIQTDSGNYMLYSEGEDYAEHRIRVLGIGGVHSNQMDRRLAARDIRFIESFHTGDSLSGLHFLCDGKHLYLTVTEFHGIKLVLRESPTDPAGIGYYSEPFEHMKIRFGRPSETGFRELSAAEDRQELFESEKKRLGAMLEHGTITKELYEEALQGLITRMKD